MNDHFEELIHDGIDELAAGSTLPAGLADRARRQVRRRQYQVRAAVAAGTAAAAAIAVIAATSAGSAGTAPSPSPSIALLAKVEQAVASKAGNAPVLQVKTTYSPGRQLSPPDPFSGVPYYSGGPAQGEITWTRGQVFKNELLNAKGQVVTATRTTGAGNLITATTVRYTSRTWWRVSLNWSRVKLSRPCTLLPFGPSISRDWSPRSLARHIRHAIACGEAKVAGRQHVDGVDAIKLIFTTANAVVSWNGGTQAIAHQVMWVDPHSYLPVRYRSVLTVTAAKPGVSRRPTWVQSDFTWLPVSRASLAKLQLTIPHGFRDKRPPAIYAPLPRVP